MSLKPLRCCHAGRRQGFYTRFKEDFPHQGRIETMRSLRILFAAACVAALALSTPASAATILSFGNPPPGPDDVVRATVGGGNTTLTTNSTANPGSYAIQITQIGNVTPPGGSQAAFETFLPALSSNSPVSGGLQNGFNGTIIISTGPNGTGGNFLTAVITNGRLSANGAAGGFEAAHGATSGGNPVTVTLTSNNPNVIAAMGGSGATFTTTGAASLAFVNITPTQSGSGFTSFTAQNTGLFSTNVIPEPASFLSAGTAILAGLGCFGWSRRKSSRA